MPATNITQGRICLPAPRRYTLGSSFSRHQLPIYLLQIDAQRFHIRVPRDRGDQIITAPRLLECAGRCHAQAVPAVIFDSDDSNVRRIALDRPLLLAKGCPRSELRMYSLM